MRRRAGSMCWQQQVGWSAHARTVAIVSMAKMSVGGTRKGGVVQKTRCSSPRFSSWLLVGIDDAIRLGRM